MEKKGIRVRHTELMTLLNIFKVTVDVDYISLEICEMRVLLLDFNSKFEFRRAMYFTYLEEL